MRELRQEEFHVKTAIQNVLAVYSADFRSRIAPEQIDRMATRLTIMGLTARKVDGALETIAGQDDTRFPTPVQIRQTLNTKTKTEKEPTPRDPQAEIDHATFKKNREQFEAALGAELLQQYIDFWHKEYFKGCDGFAEFLIPRKAFDQVAIADLARANGNPKRAIQLVRADKSRQVDYTQGEVYETKTHKVYRESSPRFVIKESN